MRDYLMRAYNEANKSSLAFKGDGVEDGIIDLPLDESVLMMEEPAADYEADGDAVDAADPEAEAGAP